MFPEDPPQVPSGLAMRVEVGLVVLFVDELLIELETTFVGRVDVDDSFLELEDESLDGVFEVEVLDDVRDADKLLPVQLPDLGWHPAPQ